MCLLASLFGVNLLSHSFLDLPNPQSSQLTLVVLLEQVVLAVAVCAGKEGAHVAPLVQLVA